MNFEEKRYDFRLHRFPFSLLARGQVVRSNYQAISDKIDIMLTSQPRPPAQCPHVQNQPPRGPRRPIVCYKCHQEGHFAQGCAELGNKQPPAVIYEDGGNNLTLTQPTPLCISPIYSFHISFVIGCPSYSFLIDTGAAATLLSYSGLNTQSGRFSSQSLQIKPHLIGVDCSPLRYS